MLKLLHILAFSLNFKFNSDKIILRNDKKICLQAIFREKKKMGKNFFQGCFSKGATNKNFGGLFSERKTKKQKNSGHFSKTKRRKKLYMDNFSKQNEKTKIFCAIFRGEWEKKLIMVDFLRENEEYKSI